ncbi:MAG: hypothetical protein RSB65_02055 [Oscillospiraceae bacterium]
MHEFTNSKTGEKLLCDFLPIAPNDSELIEGFISCVKEEYGETYPRKYVYDPALLSAEIQGGKSAFFLAVSDKGEAVSSLALTPCGGLLGVPEMTMHVIRRPFRGFGVGSVFTSALLKMPSAQSFNAVATHSVTFHPLAQHQTISCGFVPCGFLFSVHSNNILKHSFDTHGCIKQSFAVGVFPESLHSAGQLFAPTEHENFIKHIYENLGVDFSFKKGEAPSGKTLYHAHMDEIHHSYTAEVFHCGSDLTSLFGSLLSAPHHPEQTVNLLLNLRDSSAAQGFKQLRELGFLFSGLHPLCENGEFLLMHHPMDVVLSLDKLSIDQGYSELFTYIRNNIGGQS